MPLPAAAVWLALVSVVAIYFQMVLGGLVRHSGAALACTDLPLCRGAIWPDAHPTVLIHVLHRMNALLVAGLVIASSIVTFRQARGRAGLRALALLAPVLVLVQIALGVLSVRQLSRSGDRRVAPGGRDRAAGDADRRGAAGAAGRR